MSGYFTVKSKKKLSELNEGDRIEQSDFATMGPDGTFTQLQYHEEDDTAKDKMDVHPGIFHIVKTMQGYKLESTEFNKDKILEDFVFTKNIEETVDCFFNNIHIYYEEGYEVPKRAMLLFGAPGCHAKGTEILMFDGSVKKVEDVKVGDELMGPDSQPREVLKLAGGREQMVRIIPTKGDSFVVNYNHILHLTPSGVGEVPKSAINIKVSDLIENTSKVFRERMKLTRTGVDFSNKELPIDPYFLGLWLGDGSSCGPEITSIDDEIINYAKTYTKHFFDLEAHTYPKSKTKAVTVKFTSIEKTKGKNKLTNIMRELEIHNNKHIPNIYLTSSKEQRLELLAGIIDTDGSLTCNGYDYISISKKLASDVTFLSRSLGLAAYLSECKKSDQNGTEGTYYRVSISGDCSVVPVVLERKKAQPRSQIKSVLRTGFTYELLPEDNYYGFSLDKDHLYLTSDFTIHHNTGKSTIISKVCRKYVEDKKTMVLIWNTDKFEAHEVKSLVQSFNYVGVDKMILIVEDVGGVERDEVRRGSESSLLSLLDNQEKTFTIPIFIIATTNFPETLMGNLTNRPQRFDDKIEVGPPDSDSRKKLLQFFMKDLATPEELNEIGSKKCDGLTPSHIREIRIRSRIYNKTALQVIKDIVKEIELYNKAFQKNKGSVGFMHD